MKVTCSSSAALAGCDRRRHRGSQRAQRPVPRRGRERGRVYGAGCDQPAAARRRASRTSTPSTAWCAPTPTTGCAHRTIPTLLAHLVAERLWYDTATGHLSSLVETLRSEMAGRVPATDRSVSWRLQDCSYYTALPAGRENTAVVARSTMDRSGRLRRGAPGRQRAGRRLGLLELGVVPGQPRRDAAGLLGGPHRRRGLQLRFRDLETGDGPARRGAAHLLRRRVERRVATTSSTRSTTTPTGRSRCGGTRSARRAPRTCWCSRSRTSGSS